MIMMMTMVIYTNTVKCLSLYLDSVHA